MLTGKNKSNFIDHYQRLVFKQKSTYPKFELFEQLPISMQFGVIQDYADSIGYDMNVCQFLGMFMFLITAKKCEVWEESFDHLTRDEARLAAIKAFDEIVNGAT